MSEEMTDKRMYELLTGLQVEAYTLVRYADFNLKIGHCCPNDEYDDEQYLFFGNKDIQVFAYFDKKSGKEMFCLGHVVHYPGVRYYADGSGEPPSEDFSEDQHFLAVPPGGMIKTARDILDVVWSMLMNEALNMRSEKKFGQEQSKQDKKDNIEIADSNGILDLEDESILIDQMERDAQP